MRPARHPFFRIPPVRAAGIVAWLMVGQACFCGWHSLRVQGMTCGTGTDLGPGVLPSLLLAWCAFALAGDCRHHRWMVLVKAAGVAFYGFVGFVGLAFGGLPRGQTLALALTSLWIAIMFSQPPQLTRPAEALRDEAAQAV